MKHNLKWNLFPSLAFSLILGISGVCHADGLVGAKEETMWDEEYTDTDTKKGTLAVRCQVFQGFQGEVTIHFTGMAGGRTFTVSLDKDRDYIANISLPGEQYKVTGVTAMSGLREYDCHAESDSFAVEPDSVFICKVFVNPDSVRRFPEETEVRIADQVVETEIPGLEDGTEPAVSEEQTEPTVSERPVDNERNRGRIPVSAVLGMALILICTGSLFYIRSWEK